MTGTEGTTWSAPESGVLDHLEAQSDEKLKAVIERARSILSAREEQRKKEALQEIREIAKAHGLNLAVKRPAKRRGRPPKTET